MAHTIPMAVMVQEEAVVIAEAEKAVGGEEEQAAGALDGWRLGRNRGNLPAA